MKRSTRRTRGVMGQLEVALRRPNLPATAVGFVLGGFVPLATYFVSYREVVSSTGWMRALLVAFVLGGLLFSAKTVWQWAGDGFKDGWKATGFVVLVEGVMVFSNQHALSVSALSLLVIINGIATGVQLAKERA